MEKQDALGALAALSQETRLDVFRLLVQAGPEGMPAGAIGEALDLAAATLSFHLKELRNGGIVHCRREGRSLIYSPDFDRMRELMGFLTENCCEGACAPAQRRRTFSSTQAQLARPQPAGQQTGCLRLLLLPSFRSLSSCRLPPWHRIRPCT